MFNMQQKLELGAQTTFVPNKLEPIYNWFYYKEGFSRQLVELFLKEFGIIHGQIALDPFCGSGTTLLACKQNGIDALGIEVMPPALLASRVKTQNYDTESLREIVRNFFAEKFQRPSLNNVPPYIKRFFSKYALEDIVFYKKLLHNLDDAAAKDFLLLALVNSSMKVSYAWKDGGLLKVRKHPAPPLRKLYRRVVRNWIKQLEKSELGNTKTEVIKGDARYLRGIMDESVDTVITSPPYLNNIDYTKVYAIENWIVSGETEPPMRSTVGSGGDVGVPDAIKNLQIPADAVSYFTDMEKFLKEIFRVMKKGSRAAIILGNAYYTDYGVVESDIILAEMAQKIGFTVERIEVYNQRAALHERTHRVGTLRESGIILRK